MGPSDLQQPAGTLSAVTAPDDPSKSTPVSRADHSTEPEKLGHILTGDLPCISCSYELRGLSIAGQCPECGIGVRATLLYRIDPHADTFLPLRHPRLVAWGISVWAAAAFAAALASWLPRIADQWPLASTRQHWLQYVYLAPPIFLLISCAASFTLISPFRHTPKKGRIYAESACFAFAVLVVVAWIFHTIVDPSTTSPYLHLTADPSAARIALRLLIATLALAILFGLRPNARMLAARSLMLRSGRADRQTMAATAAAFAIASLGDIIRLSSIPLPRAQAGIVVLLGSILVTVGSLLVTLALAAVMIDSWRIRRVILFPSPTLHELLGDQPSSATNAPHNR